MNLPLIAAAAAITAAAHPTLEEIKLLHFASRRDELKYGPTLVSRLIVVVSDYQSMLPSSFQLFFSFSVHTQATHKREYEQK